MRTGIETRVRFHSPARPLSEGICEEGGLISEQVWASADIPKHELHFWTFDGWSENEKGGIYFYNDRRSKTPWGETRPEYGRGDERQYLKDNALMWIEECHADGLRWDAISHIRKVKGRNGDTPDDLPNGWSLMHGRGR